MPPTLVRYFAYGSNLKTSRLRDRIGKWERDQKAILRGYKRTFAKGYYDHKSGKANIRQSDNDIVEGAIYLITEEQLKKLDLKEGVEKCVYKRMPVNVESSGEKIEAQTYVMSNEICTLKPSKEYLNLIIEGLEEHCYGPDVVEKVKAIAQNS